MPQVGVLRAGYWTPSGAQPARVAGRDRPWIYVTSDFCIKEEPSRILYLDIKSHSEDKETPQANTQDLMRTFLSTCIVGISQDHVTGRNWLLPGREELGTALAQGEEPPAIWKDPKGRAPGTPQPPSCPRTAQKHPV